MSLLESLTIAAGLGAFGFLAYYLKRRLAAREGELDAPAGQAGKDERPGPSRMQAMAERGPDHPLAVLIEQELFTALAEVMESAVVLHDDRVRFANESAARQLGLAPEAMQDVPLAERVHPEHRDQFSEWLQRRREGRDVRPLSLQVLDTEDKPRWVDLVAFPVSGESLRLMGSLIRPSARHALEQAEDTGRQLARQTLDSLGEGVITTDAEGCIDFVNGAAENMLGVARDAAVGRRLEDLVALVDESDRKPMSDPVERCLREGTRVDMGRRTLLVSLGSGQEHSVEITASPIRMGSRQVRGVVVLMHDVSEIRGLARQMSYQASHDALTGLVNRREFERRLDDAVAGSRAGGGTHVLCYLDLDRFKVVNDTCGHMAGDNLLREVARLVRDQVRDSDTVARIGGDEFGMLLMGCPLDKARQIADDVCSAIRDYRFVWRDRIFTVGVSIGLVEVSHESSSIEDLLSAADSACYVAKQQGRGRVHVYSARDEAVARQRGEILWLQRIQRALKEDRFELFVQPIVSVAGRVDTGPACEVLLRMRDEDGTSISPQDFMQAAERYHLMPNVDRWVLQATFSAIASGALKLPDQRSCTINISGQTLGDPQFLDFVVDCLDHTGVAPGKICFEVKEASVSINVSHAARFIAVLHGMGCQFALDDFGSGIGSFSNLKSLSMDYLKIDGNIIRGLETDDVSEAMVSAMVKLARTLGIRVVAEHVESDTLFDMVRRMGIDFAQGYAVGRPEPLRLRHPLAAPRSAEIPL